MANGSAINSTTCHAAYGSMRQAEKSTQVDIGFGGSWLATHHHKDLGEPKGQQQTQIHKPGYLLHSIPPA